MIDMWWQFMFSLVDDHVFGFDPKPLEFPTKGSSGGINTNLCL